MGSKYYECKDCDFKILVSEKIIMANHFIDTGHTDYTKIDEEDIPNKIEIKDFEKHLKE